MGLLGNNLAVFGGSDAQGVPVYQARTLLCALPCPTTSSWTNASKDLVVAWDEMAFASGGSTPRLYAICGQNPSGPIATAEKTA
jgi:hypothetical protein